MQERYPGTGSRPTQDRIVRARAHHDDDDDDDGDRPSSH